MRLRASNHGASVAARAFTVAVMAAATLAQLSSIAHEMTVRHFRCAEHGELTHLAALATSREAVPAQRSTDALRDPEREIADAHEHCGVAFTVEGSSCAPSGGGAIGTVAPAPAVGPLPAPMIPAGHGVVLASAPKTSPPPA
ncbi:MAG TPA: hypothetical protein VKZ18_14055 [Polyangia bacterium]|nr:hypothetical protein [Polyangia bacterium]